MTKCRRFTSQIRRKMIIDFRRQERNPPTSIVHDQEVEIVSKYTYLGSIFDNKLKWDHNTDAILKKGQQRLYFLRKLRSFMVDRQILSLFYKSYIESVISFSFICWYQNLSVKNKTSLDRIVSLSSKLIGIPQRSLSTFHNQQVLRKARSILLSSDHILSAEFDTLPSGRRFRYPACRSNRRKLSFIPTAVRLLNDS